MGWFPPALIPCSRDDSQHFDQAGTLRNGRLFLPSDTIVNKCCFVFLLCCASFTSDAFGPQKCEILVGLSPGL